MVVLFLNDVAGSEILVILLFILIFFGADSIPSIARTFGKVIRQINDAKEDIQGEIKKSSGNIKKDLNLEGIFRETEEAIRQPLDQMTYDIEDSIKYERSKPVTLTNNPEENPKADQLEVDDNKKASEESPKA